MNKKQLAYLDSIKELARAILPETHIQREIANLIVQFVDDIKVEETRNLSKPPKENRPKGNIYKNDKPIEPEIRKGWW